MADADDLLQKRRRVTQACETCRSLKSKCDGKRPACSRCRGYGYTCRWKSRSNRATAPDALPIENQRESNLSDEVSSLKAALQSSQALLQHVREKLGAEDQLLIDSMFSHTALAPDLTFARRTSALRDRVEMLASHRSPRNAVSANRYLGEVSDVSFYNYVKDVLLNSASNSQDETPLESYEREAAEASDTSDDGVLELPNREIADKFLNIYFSTIHVAYPFLYRQEFMQTYNDLWQADRVHMEPSPFTALLLTIFAIGSYYDTLSNGQPSATVHSVYFRRAQLASYHLSNVRCLDNVRLLLMQCFYLLATCQTDRCWMTLGLAIRIGQSIGLHIDLGNGPRRKPARYCQVEAELRRRTWHSLYALDRLLALQLGRPSAVRNRDCNIDLPSRLGDIDSTIEQGEIPKAVEGEPMTGDYFISVIRFSKIIGHTMRDLYRPRMVNYSEETISKTERLDAELLSWKASLPRWLRFDRGHTFQTSGVLKRQRNMLAVKFHHLRALIHRPYLCLPWLQESNSNIKYILDTHSHRVVEFEDVCVREAQETAHMLHDVTDQKSLVEDFPWWQMISCLICASSILLVMRAFSSNPTNGGNMDREVLEEDANTCLKVFEALSSNSEGARLARDMLKHLRESKIDNAAPSLNEVTETPESSRQYPERTIGAITQTSPSPLGTRSGRSPVDAAGTDPYEQSMHNGVGPFWQWPLWPSEIADSMTWSSQFVDTLDPAVLGLI